MKKRIALLLVLVLALSLVLASCGGKDPNAEALEYLGFEGYYNTVYNNEGVQTVVGTAQDTGISFDPNYMDDSEVWPLVSLEDLTVDAGEVKYAVINVETGTVVYKLTMENLYPTDPEVTPAKIVKNASLRSFCNGNVTLIVEDKIDKTDAYSYVYTRTIYTALGTQIASATNKTGDFVLTSVNENTILFDGKYYEIEEDVAANKGDQGFGEYVTYQYVTASNKYFYNSGSIYVYDTAGALVASYEASADMDNAKFMVLGNGNVLIQLTKKLAYDSVEYDYEGNSSYGSVSVDDAKFQITTLIFDIASKEVTEVDFNYILASVTSEAVDDEFTDTFVAGKFENVAVVHPIVNKTVDYANSAVVSLNNDLTIVGKLGAEIPYQVGIAVLIDNNRFAVSDKLGRRYLINEKAEVLGEITGVDFIQTLGSSVFFVKDGALYNTDLTLVLDSNQVDYQEYNDLFVDTYEVVNPDDGSKKIVSDYYTFFGGAFTKLNLPEADNISDLEGYENFVSYNEKVPATDTEAEKNFFVVLNMKGVEIFRLQVDPVVVTNPDTGVITTTVNYPYASTEGDCVAISVYKSVTTSDDPYNSTESIAIYIAK